jgi:hypothetical protein
MHDNILLNKINVAINSNCCVDKTKRWLELDKKFILY